MIYVAKPQNKVEVRSYFTPRQAHKKLILCKKGPSSVWSVNPYIEACMLGILCKIEQEIVFGV